jgi:hypothetical protein
MSRLSRNERHHQNNSATAYLFKKEAFVVESFPEIPNHPVSLFPLCSFVSFVVRLLVGSVSSV